MASRLFSRNKALTLARFRCPSTAIDPVAASSRSFNDLGFHPLFDPRSSVGSTPRADLSTYAMLAPKNAGFQLSHRLGSGKIWGFVTTSQCHPFSQKLPQPVNLRAEGGAVMSQADKIFFQQLHSSGKNNMGNVADGSKEPSSLSRNESGFPNVMAFSPLEGNLVKERKSSLKAESSKVRLMELSIQITYWLIPALLLISKTQWTTSLLVLCVYWQIYGFFKEILLDYVHHEVTRTWVLVYFKLLLLILAKETILDFNMLQ